MFLDIGCGVGGNAFLLKNQKSDLWITGITLNEFEAVKARQNGCGTVFVVDVEQWEPDRKYDVIIMCHFLEHMAWLSTFLDKCHKFLNESGFVYIALTNVMKWKQRLKFLGGTFRYEESGIMDYTHLRFFDWYSAGELVRESGFEIVCRKGRGAFPVRRLRKLLPLLSETLDRWAVALFPNLFASDILMQVKPKNNQFEVG